MNYVLTAWFMKRDKWRRLDWFPAPRFTAARSRYDRRHARAARRPGLDVRRLGQTAGEHDVAPRDEHAQERDDHGQGFVVRLDPGHAQVIHGRRNDHRDH